jgi:caffeoyl-CoA O-methyltransferase
MLIMTRSSETISADLYGYLTAHSTPPDEVLTALAAETLELFPDPSGMQIGPDQGTFMTMLAKLIGARTAVEVGTFTGYSSICIARGLAQGGSLLCCDVSEEWTSVARRYWTRAGLDDRIELRLGPAIETLSALPSEPYLDLAFIDADKDGYVSYWEQIVPRIRQGGVILIDNTLSHGRVIDPSQTSSVVQGIRDFNDLAIGDARVELVLLPVGDGLTLARKR